jgi:hypothetical protein
MEKIIVAGLATLPDRVNILEVVIDSLHHQVDVIEVAFNGHKKVPDYIKNYPKVKVNLCTNEMGDANKFLNVEKYPDAYYFSCDDDIIYPYDYTQKYIEAIKKHGCVVSIHGSDMPDAPIKSYYKGRIFKAHCLNKCPDVWVDICGSGVAGFDTSVLKIKYKEFTHPNMADIFLSMQAHKQGVKRLSMAHEANWITGGLPKATTIYEDHKNNDKVQTDLVNNFNWK